MKLKVPVTWDGENYTLEGLINTHKFCALKNSPIRVLDSDQSISSAFLGGRNEGGGWEQVQLLSLNFFHGPVTLCTCSFSVNPKGLMTKLYVAIYFRRENLQVSSSTLFMGPFSWPYGSFLDPRDGKFSSPRLCAASLVNVAYQGVHTANKQMTARPKPYDAGNAQCPKSPQETPLIVNFPQRN